MAVATCRSISKNSAGSCTVWSSAETRRVPAPELAIKPLGAGQAAFLMAGWRVRGPVRVPVGRPGPARLGFGGLAGVPSAAAVRRNPRRTRAGVSRPGLARRSQGGDPLVGPAGHDRLSGGVLRRGVVEPALRGGLGVAARPHPRRQHRPAPQPLRKARLPLPRRPAPAARPLLAMDRQGRRQDRQPPAHPGTGRALHRVDRQRPAPARPHRADARRRSQSHRTTPHPGSRGLIAS